MFDFNRDYHTTPLQRISEVKANARSTKTHARPCPPVFSVERASMTPQNHNPRAAFRRTPEDDSNLIEVHAALREPQKPIATASASIRAALRVAGHLARRGQLRSILAEYRADLAGEAVAAQRNG